MGAAEDRFRVMGSEAHIVVTGGGRRHLAQTRRLLEQLELRWSRFLPESDISRANRAGGRSVDVHPDTIRLLQSARSGHAVTGGRFDPTVLPAVRARGYHRSLDDGALTVDLDAAIPASGFDAVHIDPARSSVQLDPGVGIDPGGIGKGLAADMAVERLLDDGLAGALVSIGGDLRVAGEPPDGGTWSVAIEHPLDHSRDVAVLHLEDGGVATSTSKHGRWVSDGVPVNHVIDPRSGSGVDTDVASTTVVAATAWAAEVMATGALVAGVADGLELLEGIGMHAVIVDVAGSMHRTHQMEIAL